jgi:hypothetical protein
MKFEPRWAIDGLCSYTAGNSEQVPMVGVRAAGPFGPGPWQRRTPHIYLLNVKKYIVSENVGIPFNRIAGLLFFAFHRYSLYF